MEESQVQNNTSDGVRPYIWFGIIGAFLAAINNIVAILALGVFQGPIVAFTTPFAFCLAKLRYPKHFGATILFLPVVISSIFTLNFGPPGYYKIAFMIGAICYDLTCYTLRVGHKREDKISLWKLIIAVVFYPIGLLLGGLIAIEYILIDIEIPILSRGLFGAILMVVLFVIVGGFSSFVCHRIYYRFLIKEISK